MKKVISEGKTNDDFDLCFYASDEWGDKANSTSRLLISNYQAINNLIDNGFDIHQLGIVKVDEKMLNSFFSYDLIVVNQTARKSSHEMTAKIIDFIDREQIFDRVIFGTEVTWYAELNKGSYTQEQVDLVYKKATLLRHTAKTDRPIYANNSKNNIIEFEIGLDTDLVRPKKLINERNLITFVCAPEGRATKNNELVDEIIDEIHNYAELEKYEICKVSPPYRTADLWSIYDNTKYLIFTSQGETFSYVLNDAKSKGVITLYPEHMYNNNVAGYYTVVSYPQSGIHYKTINELVEKILKVESKPSIAVQESAFSREFVVNNFSIKSIGENWKKLILQKPLNIFKCYVFSSDYDEFKTAEDFNVFLNREGIGFVIVVKDDLNVTPCFDSLSYFDAMQEVVYHKYLYNVCAESSVRKYISLDPESKFYKFSKNGDIVDKIDREKVVQFLNLFKRINKINVFVSHKRTAVFFLNEYSIELCSV